MSQPLSLLLIAGKLVVRLLALLTILIPLPLIFLLLFLPETRGVDTLLLMLSWSALVTCYILFWFAVAAWSTWWDCPLRPMP